MMASERRSYAKEQPNGFSNELQKVAIVGVGGQMGRHIVQHLLQSGKHILTAITRPSSTSHIPEGVKAHSIDYSGEDTTALVEALQGQQVLIITMSLAAPRNTISKLIRAAAAAGVPYVLPNWFGHDAANDALCQDSLLGPMRDSICDEIRRLGVSSYLLLVCSFWYEFSLGGGPNRYGFDFKKRSLIVFDNGNVAINTSTWPQCGQAIANLLSLKELPEDETDQAPSLSQFRNGTIYISSFRLSQRDMFDSVKRVTGTTDADWTVTHESARKRWEDGQKEFREGDINGFTKQLYSRLFFPNGDGDYQSSRRLHNDILGLSAENLDDSTAIAIRMGENDEVSH